MHLQLGHWSAGCALEGHLRYFRSLPHVGHAINLGAPWRLKRHARAVPPQKAPICRIASSEDVEDPCERVHLHLLLHQPGQPIHAFTKSTGLVPPGPSRRPPVRSSGLLQGLDHRRDRLGLRAAAHPHHHSVDLSSIPPSRVRRRRGFGFAARALRTVGRRRPQARTLPGLAPPPYGPRAATEELLRAHVVPARHMRDNRPRRQRLHDDIRLDVGIPLPPAPRPGNHLDAPNRARLQHVRMIKPDMSRAHPDLGSLTLAARLQSETVWVRSYGRKWVMAG